MKKKRNVLYKKPSLKRNINKKILFAYLVSYMIIIATSSSVLAATSDSVEITFNPDGDIDIDVNLSFYNFSSIISGNWGNTSGNMFLLWNNGSVAMDTQIETNDSTDEAQMWLNLSGAAPSVNQYAIMTINLGTVDKYLNNTYGTEGYYSTGLLPNDNDGFDLGILLGNLSANHSWQTTTIRFQGSQS